MPSQMTLAEPSHREDTPQDTGSKWRLCLFQLLTMLQFSSSFPSRPALPKTDPEREKLTAVFNTGGKMRSRKPRAGLPSTQHPQQF